MPEILPREGAKTVFLLDGTLTWAWPVEHIDHRAEYRLGPNGEPIHLRTQLSVLSRWGRVRRALFRNQMILRLGYTWQRFGHSSAS